jgi:hypothetical protein
MTKKHPTPKKIESVSRELKGASAAAAASMDSTVGDGLAADGASGAVTILISTPHGQVTSRPLPFEAADEVREVVESGIARIERLTMDTPNGLVIIPGDLLRQSLIQFVSDNTGGAGGVTLSQARLNKAVVRPGKKGGKRRSGQINPVDAYP